MSICPKCKLKPRRNNHGYCTQCKSEIDKVKRETDPTVRIRERISELKRKYNLTLEDYDKLFIDQNGECAICLSKMKLHVDHDHKTGKVRGLLCEHCNHALGKFRDSSLTLFRAIKYLNPNSKIEERFCPIILTK